MPLSFFCTSTVVVSLHDRALAVVTERARCELASEGSSLAYLRSIHDCVPSQQHLPKTIIPCRSPPSPHDEASRSYMHTASQAKNSGASLQNIVCARHWPGRESMCSANERAGSRGSWLGQLIGRVFSSTCSPMTCIVSANLSQHSYLNWISLHL